MKIVRLTTLLDFGGQERKYISFAKMKGILQHEYIFSAISYGGHAEEFIKEQGFEVKIFNRNPAIRNISTIITLYKWFKSIKPDVVHTAAAEANFHGVIAAKLAGVPYIIAEEIGFPSHSKKARLVFKCCYYLTDNVVCVSKAVKDFLISIGELQSSKAVVIYNPVITPLSLEKSTLVDGKFKIVSVGRLEKVKNMQLLIETFATLQLQDKATLTIVGDGRERLYLESLISQYQLEGSVSITGFSSTPEEYVTSADLFILPSLSEGFGIAVVEAMLQKVPCLCSKVGGIPEFIEDGISGWLFDPNDKVEFSQKLSQCINMKEEVRNEIAEKGFDSVNGVFTLEKYVNVLEDLYEKK